MTVSYDVLIVGAGHGGAQTAISLRQGGFLGSVALLGDEPGLPYERPPLTKDYLAGDRPFEAMLIRPAAFWREHAVALLPQRRVVGVDAGAHTVGLDNGDTLGYGSLVWATGATPRAIPLPKPSPRGVHSVRNRADVDRILGELPTVNRVLVIGGGYIGLETAAVLNKKGKAVTVLEAQDRVLARVAGEPLSRFYEGQHRRHGVDVRTGTALEALQTSSGAVSGAQLSDGSGLSCEMVIIGIGVIPCVAPLLDAGARGSNGVEVDEHCRTTLPDVFAIGDCAAQANYFAGGAMIRVESLQNATDQAGIVARLLCGGAATVSLALPRFWSNQYDLRLQTVGLSAGHDQQATRGDPGTGSFSVVYLKAGKVIALDCVNATRDFVQGRALVLTGAQPDIGQLSDSHRPLKDLLTTRPTVPTATRMTTGPRST